MSLIQIPTKVMLEGKGALTLRPNDYVTQGGEGAIYRKDKHIIKLYLDPTKMVKDGMSEKVRLLAKSFAHPSIVAPKGVVHDEHGMPLGYYMPYVSGVAYPKLFTNDGRAEVGFTDESARQLAFSMRAVITEAHHQGALLVDGNELNWLADITNPKLPVPYAIDVDSWQIGRFKAAVIMPSIRDWHSATITSTTDWFAWGIVTFLLFTGIHPYKGTLAGYKPGELERRMRDNASIFNPGVRLNKTVRDLSCIPAPLLDWYQATFAQGLRTIPPSPLELGKGPSVAGRILRMVTSGTGGLVYEKIFEANSAIVSIWPCGLMRTKLGDLFDYEHKRQVGVTTAAQMAAVKSGQGWLMAEQIGSEWQFRYLSGNGQSVPLSTLLNVETVFRSDNRLFAVTDCELVELAIQQFGKPILIPQRRWSIMGNATSWYRGVGIADLLGSIHLILPSGTDGITQVKVPELSGVRVIGAVGHGRYVEVMTVTQNGNYEALQFMFTHDLKSYRLTTETRDDAEQNLVILPKGVVAQITKDGELSILVPQTGEQKLVTDTDIATTMRLGHQGDRVIYRHENTVWSLRMR